MSVSKFEHQVLPLLDLQNKQPKGDLYQPAQSTDQQNIKLLMMKANCKNSKRII
jgi:hypothetical protein